MRPATFFLLLALAGVLAAAAHGSARPVRASDRTLLARPATAEEIVAEHVAERLTGHKDVSVRCGPLGIHNANVLGATPILNGHSFDYFLMLPAECTYLAWFHDAPERWNPSTCHPEDCASVGAIAQALQTVAHESYHVLGYTNEAQVECYGMQSLWFVANKLGASVVEAQAYARIYATQMYPLRRFQTPLYWSSECRDGGKYDLRPRSHAWPS